MVGDWPLAEEVLGQPARMLQLEMIPFVLYNNT